VIFSSSWTHIMEKSLVQYCLARFEEFFSQHIPHVPEKCNLLEESDYEEIFLENNVLFHQILGITVSKEKRMEYIRCSDCGMSSRHIQSKRMYVGDVILLSILFVWDDLPDELVEKHYGEAVKEVQRIAEKYFEPRYHDLVIRNTVNGLLCNTKTRKNEFKKKLFQTSLSMYWNARGIDSGLFLWISLAAPIYLNDDLVDWVNAQLPLQLMTKGICLVNDVLSFNMEQKETDAPNCLYFTDVQDREKFVLFLEAHLKEVGEDIQVIKTLPQPIQNVMLDLLYGHFLWSRDSPRYKMWWTD